MPKKDLTEIICVIDKSGSMYDIKNDAIEGFNTFLAEQKKQPGEATMTIVLFDTQYSFLVNGKSIQDVQELNSITYSPGGFTALLDAVGRAIDEVGQRLSNMPEEERPEKVIMAILTDGEENSSKEYSRQQVFDKIKHQKEIYKWEFIFLAAGQNAIQSAASIGINSNRAMNFVADADGIGHTYSVMGQSISSYRNSGNIDTGII
jgi:uncharacterized protein YegL